MSVSLLVHYTHARTHVRTHTHLVPSLSHSAQITSVYQCLSTSVTCAAQRGSPEVRHAAHEHMLQHCAGCYTKALVRWDQVSNHAHPEADKQNSVTLCGDPAGIS